MIDFCLLLKSTSVLGPVFVGPLHVQSAILSNAGYPIKTYIWIPLPGPAAAPKSEIESLRGDFRWAQKLALAVSVSLASLGGVFGICLPRDSYFEFGSLGTHWPSSLPHRHLPPPSIRVICWTAKKNSLFPHLVVVVDSVFAKLYFLVWVCISCNSCWPTNLYQNNFHFRSISRSVLIMHYSRICSDLATIWLLIMTQALILIPTLLIIRSAIHFGCTSYRLACLCILKSKST